MRRQPALAILTLCLAAFPALFSATSAAADGESSTEGPRPILVVDDAVKDFGEVPRGQKLEHEYILRNDGTAVLKISRVAPSCGCTVAEYDREIAPGMTGKIKAVVDTATLQGPTSRSIAVFTNDAKVPRVNLTFKVDAIALLGVEPGYARFITVHGEAPRGLLKQWIWAEDDHDLKVVKVDSPYSYLKTSFRLAEEDEKKEGRPDKQWIVETELLYNEAPVGPLADNIVIHTDHPKQKEARIPVSGFVRPTVWVTPHEANLGEIDTGEPVSFSLLIHNFATNALELTAVESDVKGLKTEINSVEEGRKFSVQVTLDSAMPKGDLDGMITIRTNNPTKPVIEVPLKGKVL